MSVVSNVSLVDSGEQLARFVLFSRWVRRSGPEKTVKPDAFIPHPHVDLSVTRHTNLSEEELWMIGQEIANTRPATLYGRADLSASNIRQQPLQVEARPVPGNPNHACIVGWPADKPAQKIIAQQLAACAQYRDTPPDSS
jgi:hypothetical protein